MRAVKWHPVRVGRLLPVQCTMPRSAPPFGVLVGSKTRLLDKNRLLDKARTTKHARMMMRLVDIDVLVTFIKVWGSESTG